MRSPRKVCSRGSSHTAHSLPTNVRSLRLRLLSPLMMLDIFSPGKGRCSACRRVSLDSAEPCEADE